MELVKVQSSGTTVKARWAGLTNLALGGVATYLGLSAISADVQVVVSKLSDPELLASVERIWVTAKWVGLAMAGVATLASLLPAVQGWMTTEREKPLEDVKLKAVGPPAGSGLVLAVLASGFLLGGCAGLNQGRSGIYPIFAPNAGVGGGFRNEAVVVEALQIPDAETTDTLNLRVSVERVDGATVPQAEIRAHNPSPSKAQVDVRLPGVLR